MEYNVGMTTKFVYANIHLDFKIQLRTINGDINIHPKFVLNIENYFIA